MKAELHALIALLEEHQAQNQDGDLVALLDRARALDTLDEEQLSRAVEMTHEHFGAVSISLSADSDLAAQLLDLLDGGEQIEDEEDE